MDSKLDALDSDCLLEFFARCRTPDLLALGQTCKRLRRLLEESARPWTARLAADFGLRVRALPDCTSKLSNLARQVYGAPTGKQIRFQAIQVDGGVDGDDVQYWADNLFLPPPVPPASKDRYYCSNCQRNATVLALLLDGEVEREAEHARAVAYVRHRCEHAVAAAVNQDPQPWDEINQIVEGWSQAYMLNLFLALADLLQNNGPGGELLLADVPQDRTAEERDRIRAVDIYLRQWLANTRADMLQRGNLWFDASVVPKIANPERHRLVGLLTSLSLSRAGHLTCPVAVGAVIAGTIDYDQLEGCTGSRIAEMLHAATQHTACSTLDSLESEAAVRETVAKGLLPEVARRGEVAAGHWLEFGVAAPQHPSGPGSAEASPRPDGLVAWTPLVWFRFHTLEEALLHAAPRGSDDENAAQGGGAALAAQPLLGHGAEAGAVDAVQPAHEVSSEAGEDNSGAEDSEDEQGGIAAQVGPLPEPAPAGVELVLGGGFQGDGPHTLLEMELTRPRVANVLCIKLINQENHMLEAGDDHDWPNIDANYICLKGKLVHLPSGVALVL